MARISENVKLRTDVLRDTWLSERYSCDGAPIRTPYFFEYPSLLAILPASSSSKIFRNISQCQFWIFFNLFF